MRFAIIDVANLFHRCMHVTRGDAFTKSGMALHIIFRSLRRLYREMKVDHMVFATEGGSWRYKVYPNYKIDRRMGKVAKDAKEKEEEEVFFSVMDDFINFIAEKTRCTVLHSQGIEGDDFIGRWIELHPNDEHIVLSGDSDFVQLIAPNVKLVVPGPKDQEDRVFSTDGVSLITGEPLIFSIDSGTGRIKVPGETVAEAKKKHDKAQKEAEKAHIAEQKARAKAHEEAQKELPKSERTPYVATPYQWVEFEFTPEPEWWRKALFVKIIRGDSGDSIFSAYPGASYKGTSKRTGICQAWDDRHEGSFHWNNFMLQRWEKLIGVDESGNNIKKEVRVIDEFKINESLIDLTKQPQDVKDLMDAVIVQAVQKDPVNAVGIHFLRFCDRNNLPNLSREASEHAAYLNAPYGK